MKNALYKRIFLLIFLLYSYQCLSQSNLQFNTVITQTGTLSGGHLQSLTTQVFTVPAGKVWKLERYTRGKLLINGIPIRDEYSTSSGIFIDTAPIWLNSGDFFHFKLWGTGMGNWTDYWHFSLIEFNK
jgi:hypothetical protein